MIGSKVLEENQLFGNTIDQINQAMKLSIVWTVLLLPGNVIGAGSTNVNKRPRKRSTSTTPPQVATTNIDVYITEISVPTAIPDSPVGRQPILLPPRIPGNLNQDDFNSD